jgi:hypothetical protein
MTTEMETCGTLRRTWLELLVFNLIYCLVEHSNNTGVSQSISCNGLDWRRRVGFKAEMQTLTQKVISWIPSLLGMTLDRLGRPTDWVKCGAAWEGSGSL